MVSLHKPDVDWFYFTKAFNGKDFYDKYNNVEFLKQKENLRLILLKSDALEKRYKALQPGASLAISGMCLKPGVSLVLKKSKLVDESDIDQDDFTLRRLLGLVAAYVNDHCLYQNVYSIESERFGLSPDLQNSLNTSQNTQYGGYDNFGGQKKDSDRKFYYSAISGAEYFVEQFGYFPFLFALRRYHLKQISEEMLLEIAYIRDKVTEKALVMLCAEDITNARKTAQKIGYVLDEAVKNAPQSIKCIFKIAYY